MDQEKKGTSSLPAAEKKIIIGSIVLILGQLSPLILIPIVVSLDLSSGWTTALSGLLMFGPEEIAWPHQAITQMESKAMACRKERIAAS